MPRLFWRVLLLLRLCMYVVTITSREAAECVQDINKLEYIHYSLFMVFARVSVRAWLLSVWASHYLSLITSLCHFDKRFLSNMEWDVSLCPSSFLSFTSWLVEWWQKDSDSSGCIDLLTCYVYRSQVLIIHWSSQNHLWCDGWDILTAFKNHTIVDVVMVQRGTKHT